MIEYPPVKTKRDFVRRYSNGDFGNRSPTWDKLRDFQEHTPAPHSLYHLRNRITAGSTHYNLNWYQAFTTWLDREDKENWYCSQMCPTERTVLQGEVMQSPRSLDLFYTTVARPMREALAIKATQVYGLEASLLLKGCMNAKSYDWLLVLLERYPEHVIEFTALDICWGTIPGYNVLYWEVRRDY